MLTEALMGITIKEIIAGVFTLGSFVVLFFKKNEWVIPVFKRAFELLKKINSRSGKIDLILKELSVNNTSINRIENKLVVIENTLEVMKRHDEIAFDLHDMATFKTNEKGHCIWMSKAYQRLAGMNQQELIGDGWVNVIYGEDREKVYKEWNFAVSQKRDFHFNFRYQNGTTKEVFPVEVHAFVSKTVEDGIIGWIGTTKREEIAHKVDIKSLNTKVKQLSDLVTPKDRPNLKEIIDDAIDLAELGSLRCQELLLNSNDGIFECDINGECIYGNKTLQNLFGLSYESLLGRGWLDGIHYEDKNRVLHEWQNCARNNLTYYCEYTVLGENKDHPVRVFAKAKPFRNSKGKILLYHGVVKPLNNKK